MLRWSLHIIYFLCELGVFAVALHFVFLFVFLVLCLVVVAVAFDGSLLVGVRVPLPLPFPHFFAQSLLFLRTATHDPSRRGLLSSDHDWGVDTRKQISSQPPHEGLTWKHFCLVLDSSLSPRFLLFPFSPPHLPLVLLYAPPQGG